MLLAPNGSNALLDEARAPWPSPAPTASRHHPVRRLRQARGWALRPSPRACHLNAVFDNVYTLLIDLGTEQRQQLNRKGRAHVGHQWARRCKPRSRPRRRSIRGEELQARMNALRVTLTATIQADVQRALQTQSRRASVDAAQAASACILASSSSSRR